MVILGQFLNKIGLLFIPASGHIGSAAYNCILSFIFVFVSSIAFLDNVRWVLNCRQKKYNRCRAFKIAFALSTPTYQPTYTSISSFLHQLSFVSLCFCSCCRHRRHQFPCFNLLCFWYLSLYFFLSLCLFLSLSLSLSLHQLHYHRYTSVFLLFAIYYFCLPTVSFMSLFITYIVSPSFYASISP